MYMAIIVEETVSGFHRETLWYGGDPENLASTILDVMNDWYEPNKKKLDKTIIKYHEMLEEKDSRDASRRWKGRALKWAARSCGCS